MRSHRPWAVVVIGIALGLAPRPVLGQLRALVVASGFNQPLGFVQDPTDKTIQYVVEQGGRIRVLRGGVLLSTDFIDLSGSIVSGGEQGLLGLAFPPPGASTTRFFVNFTNRSGDTVVARFGRSTANRLVANPASRLDLLWSTGERVIRQPFPNHNGGQLAFGPDGDLYVGMGDGGFGNDPANRAQDPSTLLGKMLRIDVNVPDGDNKGFRVPSDNPFLVASRPLAAQPEIWAFGFRNPWRFSFDDLSLGGTGAMAIGDVGQNFYEEVDYEPRGRGGRNYGWRLREGTHPHDESLPPAFGPLTEPLLDYDHTQGFAVIGGYVYRGRALGPAYQGRYFFGDLNGRIWSVGLALDPDTGDARVIDRAEHTSELGGAAALQPLTSFGVDAAGELYIVSQSGQILRIVPADTDGDGLPDWWERQFGLNPDSARGDDGADGDPDHDGRTNLEEYRAGTHPRGIFRRSFGLGLATGGAGAVVFRNPSSGSPASIVLLYRRRDGTSRSEYLRLAPRATATIDVVRESSGSPTEFLALLESDVALVRDR